MTYSATFSKQVTVDYVDCPYLPAQLAMVVQSFVGFSDAGLFVYRIDPDTGTETFSHVATPCDLDSYVFNGATTEDFVRRSSMTKFYPSALAADTGIAEVETAVQTLCNTMEKITVLAPATTVTISS
jgi:hypothetical protein